MPGFDGSGPIGNGRGGRGLGPCGQGGGRGMGQGGRGMGQGGRGMGQGGRGMGRGIGGFGGGRFGAGLAAINPFRRWWGGNAQTSEKEIIRQDLEELKERERVLEQRMQDLEPTNESTE